MTEFSRAGAFVAPHVSDPDVEELLEDLQDNIDGHIHGPESGLALPGDNVVRQAATEIDRHCSRSPMPPSSESFVQWFSAFASEELTGARCKWHTCCQEVGSVNAHLFLTSSKVFNPSAEKIWDEVQAIGQFFQDSISYQSGLLTLCAFAREVFTSQPTRLFLHGLYIRKSQAEIWVFDRSGIYCCNTFNIQTEFARFQSLLITYRLMADKDLGESKILEKDDTGQFIRLEDWTWNSLGKDKLYIDDEPLSRSEDLVGACTTCYRARLPDSDRWKYVVKFKWRLANDRAEEEMLKLANEKNAWGVVSVDYYKELTSTATVRQDLQWGPYRKFRTRLGQKVPEVNTDTETIADHTVETDKAFEDRVFSCAVNSPAGRPLHTFKTRLELLEALRDAVKAHQSLFKDAGILHQDVSAYNIIITDSPNEGDPKGILIDLDVAIDLKVGPRKPGEVTGTRPFMSIGILRCRPHRYRHDLESFLYVLLWTIISNGNENPPVNSKLRVWNRGTWYESAMQKTHDMHKQNFGDILAEFPPAHDGLKPLAEALRQLLFPIEDGELWTGTNGAPEFVNALYAGIIGAFEGAIEREKTSRWFLLSDIVQSLRTRSTAHLRAQAQRPGSHRMDRVRIPSEMQHHHTTG